MTDVTGHATSSPQIGSRCFPPAADQFPAAVKTRKWYWEKGNSTLRLRAVVFDDNALTGRALWNLFDRRGYEVFTFPEPGMCSLHVVRQCPCPPATSCADLIISDVNMREASGVDLIEQLLQKGCKQRHCALMSANFSEPDLARASKIGYTPFNKPLDFAKLTAWVEEVERSIPSERILTIGHRLVQQSRPRPTSAR